ncbi:hypothetical protein B0H14DRAFT_2605570 [Mycena olivaceomarginata]|nr:hypothetical protein B0H14DRAFT_2605570 [Mycena olivaceomarginata]
MQFNVLAFLAALFTVAAAKTDCLTILQGAACPVGYRVCGPVRIDQTKCCPYGKKWIIGSASSHDVIGMSEIGHAGPPFADKITMRPDGRSALGIRWDAAVIRPIHADQPIPNFQCARLLNK